MSAVRLGRTPAQARAAVQQLKAAPSQWQNSRPGMVVVATITLGALSLSLIHI